MACPVEDGFLSRRPQDGIKSSLDRVQRQRQGISGGILLRGGNMRSVASFEVSEAAGPTEMTTRTEHTGRQSRQCCGSSTHEGRAIGESHEAVGDSEVLRKHDGWDSSKSPLSSSGATGGWTAEKKELDAVPVRLGRLHEELPRAKPAGPESQSEEFRKKRVRSLSIPSPDMLGASEQSVVQFQRPTPDKDALMATLIDQGGSFVRSSNYFSLSV